MAGTNKLKPSKQIQAMYLAYKQSNRLDKNFRSKLERHLKKFPNDLQAKEALKKGTTTQRKAPTKKLGWVKGSANASLRKEQAYSNAKVSKIVSKASNINLKASYKKATVSPFISLVVLKGTLPEFKDSFEPSKKHNYKRMKTRTK